MGNPNNFFNTKTQFSPPKSTPSKPYTRAEFKINRELSETSRHNFGTFPFDDPSFPPCFSHARICRPPLLSHVPQRHCRGSAIVCRACCFSVRFAFTRVYPFFLFRSWDCVGVFDFANFETFRFFL